MPKPDVGECKWLVLFEAMGEIGPIAVSDAVTTPGLSAFGWLFNSFGAMFPGWFDDGAVETFIIAFWVDILRDRPRGPV